jgi:hypothetical protein
MSDRYNGYTNYETWCAELWIANDPAQHEYWREQARACMEADAYDGQWNLAGMLEEETKDACPDMPGFYSDLVWAALSRVNWNEIAGHFINEMEAERANS